MSESYPSDAQLNALSGLMDGEQEVLFIATGESPYYTSFYKMLYRLLDVARRAGDLRVYKDGDLTFGVRAGKFCDGTAARNILAASGQALTDNSVNSIYIDSDGSLAVSTTGFPSPADAPHVPLATITTAGGNYAHADIVDCRGPAMFRPLSTMTAAAANSVAATSLTPSFAATAEDNDERVVTIQLKNALGDNAGRAKVRLWIAATNWGAPDATGNTVVATAGTVLRQIAENADYELITDADGACAVGITIEGAASRFVLVEVAGNVYASGQLDWSA